MMFKKNTFCNWIRKTFKRYYCRQFKSVLRRGFFEKITITFQVYFNSNLCNKCRKDTFMCLQVETKSRPTTL